MVARRSRVRETGGDAAQSVDTVWPDRGSASSAPRSPVPCAPERGARRSSSRPDPSARARRSPIGHRRSRTRRSVAAAVTDADLSWSACPVGACGAIWHARLRQHLQAGSHRLRRRFGEGRRARGVAPHPAGQRAFHSRRIRSPAPSIPGPTPGFAELFVRIAGAS